ncbi:MAG: hypothetical protein EXX96DRAFT_569391 [Benjaminiella poitrasii]|nr:MAG: hypothetical protein EXX96DRAFT_569391 [Benjaminiella poitrasii]
MYSSNNITYNNNNNKRYSPKPNNSHLTSIIPSDRNEMRETASNEWLNFVHSEVGSVSDFNNDILHKRSIYKNSDSPIKINKRIPQIQQNQGHQHQHQIKPVQIVPTKQQLDLILPDPPNCFCGKPAHRSFTLEYGPILDCDSYNLDPSTVTDPTIKIKSKFVCGFHVHEKSWNEFRQQLKNGHTVNSEFSELRSCPLYNFTYCTIFHLSNPYLLVPPPNLPECFCHRPVVMRFKDNSIQFVCKNNNVDGARKCSWILPANEVAFPRPEHRIHTRVSQDIFIDQKQEKKKLLDDIRRPPPSVDAVTIGTSSTSFVVADDTPYASTPKTIEMQHKFDLLAALTAPSSSSSSPAPRQQDDQLSPSKKQSNPPPIKPLIVPTCVMVKKKKQDSTQDKIKNKIHSPSSSPSLSSTPSSESSVSSLHSSTVTSPVITEHAHLTTTVSLASEQDGQDVINALREEIEAIKIQNKQEIEAIRIQKEQEMETIKIQIDEALKENKKKSEVIERFKRTNQELIARVERQREKLAKFQTTIYRSRNEADEEVILRLNCQERLSSIELEVVHWMNENEKLKEELYLFAEENRKLVAEDEQSKCKVCFTRNIEYILFPCCHFAYCQPCASKLTECAVCRRAIESAKRVYTC